MNLLAAAAEADVNWNHMGDWSVLGWLLMVAFWALIIVGLVWLVRDFAGPHREAGASADEILERRLAAGEIGVEEYRERSAALKGTSHPTS